MKKFLRQIFQFYLRNKFKKKAIIGKKIIFNRNTKILSNNKDNIQISDNVLMFGKLISGNNGKIFIDSFTSVRGGCIIYAAKKINIGKNVIFADNVIISDTNHHSVNPQDRLKMIQSGWSSKLWSWKYSISKEIIIKDNVWLGQYSRVLKGVVIGENSIVASNTIVTKDIPPNSIAAGNPAKIIKRNIQEENKLI